jgi:phage-related protein
MSLRRGLNCLCQNWFRLWEVRSDLTDGKIGRVIFCVARGRMVLLHSFGKKTQKTPAQDLRLALKRMKEVL